MNQNKKKRAGKGKKKYREDEKVHDEPNVDFFLLSGLVSSCFEKTVCDKSGPAHKHRNSVSCL